jgi:hypothetical protein
MGSRSAIPHLKKNNNKTYAFYMRSTTYKKQGAPNRRSTSSIIFSARFAAYRKQVAP